MVSWPLSAAVLAFATLAMVALVPAAAADSHVPDNGGFETALLVGRYYTHIDGNDTFQPDGLFKIQYRATDVGVERVLRAPHGSGFTFGLKDTESGGTLEIMVPGNFPFNNSDHNDPGPFTVLFHERDGKFHMVPYPESTKTKCHYVYQVSIRPGDDFLVVTFPFEPTGARYTIGYVPESCIWENMVRYDGGRGSALSPAGQQDLGIDAESVLCPLSFSLIFRHDGSPACTSEEAALELQKRGWTHPDMQSAYLGSLEKHVWFIPRG